jgi:hypothetical protein
LAGQQSNFSQNATKHQKLHKKKPSENNHVKQQVSSPDKLCKRSQNYGKKEVGCSII